MTTILLALSLFVQTSIYSFSVAGIDSTTINLNNYQHKKILLVNIATDSPKASQLGELQQLQEQYADSLVIIAFPSNSFGHEPRTNSEIKSFCQSTYSVTFPVASKGDVKGENIQTFYYWLTHASENGVFSYEIQDDFQKFLFDSDGNPLGVFAGSLSSLSSQVTDAIMNINQ